MIRATIMIAGFSVSSALVVGGAPKFGMRMASPMMGTVAETLATTNGPDIYWGPDGPLQDPMKEESDFKEYDSYSMFLEACSSTGVDLSAPDITVFAPANTAVAEYTSIYGPLTKEICEYHVVKGVVPGSMIGSVPLETVEGSTIAYRRMFRKDFIDNAFTCAKASPPRSSYLGDIKADNGVIHQLNEVIYPGWSESPAATARRATPPPAPKLP